MGAGGPGALYRISYKPNIYRRGSLSWDRTRDGTRGLRDLLEKKEVTEHELRHFLCDLSQVPYITLAQADGRKVYLILYLGNPIFFLHNLIF